MDSDAQISYRFSRSSLPFDLDKSTGEIRSSRRLDREEGVSEFSVTVIAQDQGGKSDTTRVLIKLVDQNDNPPLLIYPKPSKDVIQITVGAKMNENVVNLRFEDKDQGKNGKILATLERQSSLLRLVGSKIVLAKNVERKDLGLYPTRIRLQDLGEPSLFTNTRVSLTFLIYRVSYY